MTSVWPTQCGFQRHVESDPLTWDFETDPTFKVQLDWIDEIVRAEIEPLDHIVADGFDLRDPIRARVIPPLQDLVRARGLWACHLPPELGGQGYGQVQLALMNEILGRSNLAPIVFGCQAPDAGNAEILALYGSDALKESYLEPLLRNEIVSAFSMTEPAGGSDPTTFVTQAVLDGEQWVINGEKWFSSNAAFARFLLVLAVSEPEEKSHRRMSMFVIPADTPGVEIVRNVRMAGALTEGSHGYVRYREVRIPADHILGNRGDGFVVAQTRLGGGRVHHAMRTVGMVKKAFDDMCERAVSRQVKGEALARKQMVQEMIAESWIQIEQFRLLVLRTAWKIDRSSNYEEVRADISAVKIAMPKVLRDVASCALQIHGSLGVSDEMPFGSMILRSYQLGLADGPTEVHKVTLARQVLKEYQPVDTAFPSGHLPALREAALQRYGHIIDETGELVATTS
jgi:acyl-CoA dehydrogenase